MLELQKIDAEWSQKMLIAEDKRFLRLILSLISHSCDSWYWLAGLILVWIFNQGPVRQMAVFMAFCMVLLAVIVLGIKFVIKRPRPEGEFGQIYRETDPHSFPSGHAARAMAIAVIVATFGKPWLSVLVFLWAFLVGYSRVALALHYISDVLVGWLVGLLSGLLAIWTFPFFLKLLETYFPFLL